jgi:beta-barrel assembly-enhancing protease
MQYTPKLDHPTINTERREHIKDIVLILIATILGIIIFVFTAMFIAQFIIGSISFEQEQRWFSWMASIVESKDIKNPQMKSIFAKSGVEDLAGEVKVKMSCSDELNAFALPGGTIVLTSQIFKTLQTEEGLVFVVGHEVGHIKNRDHLNGMAKSVTLIALDMFIGIGSWPGFDILTNLLMSAYSRDQEMAADRVSLQQMKKIYDHTKGGEEFFLAIKNDPKAQLHQKLWFLSSHPLTEDRLKYFELQNRDFLTHRRTTNRRVLFNQVLCESGCDASACKEEIDDGPKSLKDLSTPEALAQILEIEK